MKVVTDIRKSAPAMAVVGVTDLAVGKLRSAQADLSAKASSLPGKAVAGAEALRAELTPAKIQADVQNLPNLAISKTLEVAGKAEETYGDLAARGKSLVDSVRRRSSTKDLLAQGRSTVTLGKAAVTTVRKSLVGEAQTEAKAAKPAAKKATKKATKKAAKKATKKATKPAAKKATKATKATTSPRPTAKRTATTATTRSANVKRATKATATSARKTAAKTATATATAANATGR